MINLYHASRLSIGFFTVFLSSPVIGWLNQKFKDLKILNVAAFIFFAIFFGKHINHKREPQADSDIYRRLHDQRQSGIFYWPVGFPHFLRYWPGLWFDRYHGSCPVRRPA